MNVEKLSAKIKCEEKCFKILYLTFQKFLVIF